MFEEKNRSRDFSNQNGCDDMKIEKLTENDVLRNTTVQVMMGASQRKYECDLLVIDENLSI